MVSLPKTSSKTHYTREEGCYHSHFIGEEAEAQWPREEKQPVQGHTASTEKDVCDKLQPSAVLPRVPLEKGTVVLA